MDPCLVAFEAILRAQSGQRNRPRVHAVKVGHRYCSLSSHRLLTPVLPPSDFAAIQGTVSKVLGPAAELQPQSQ